MDEHVRISIIIPSYNTPEEYVSRALESVRAQTFTDYEVIVVDDGSEPAYHEALARAVAGCEKARLLTIEHGGVSWARNAGVAAARGDYIAFLDADDVLTDIFLSSSYRYSVETDADLTVGGIHTLDRFGASPVPSGTSTSFHVYEDNELDRLPVHFIGNNHLLRFENCYIGRGPVARLIKASVLRENPFDPSLTVGEDLVWNLLLLRSCRKVCVVNELWYLYWLNPNSATRGYNKDIFRAWQVQLAEILKLIDLNDPAQYDSFVVHLFEGAIQLWNCYLCRAGAEDPEGCRRITRSLYTEYPWRMLGERRFFRQASLKYKTISLLYRCRLLLPAIHFRKRTKNIWKSF